MLIYRVSKCGRELGRIGRGIAGTEPEEGHPLAAEVGHAGITQTAKPVLIAGNGLEVAGERGRSR